jgi:hypothetical protein
MKRVLAGGRHATYHTLAFQSPHTLFSDAVSVFMFESYSAFAVLQSQIHELWARFLGSSLEDRLRYIPEKCFDTFPFPDLQTHYGLEDAGKSYYDFRATLMVRSGEGLTSIYNRFHDPENRDPEIEKMRELHAEMDRAVLNVYGWSDIKTDYEFLLDYEIDEEEWGSKKKPWRYRWPDEVRDEVLARLLELNAKRTKEEARSAAATGRKGQKNSARRSPKALEAEDLFS